MDDNMIVDLFLKKDELAISATAEKYMTEKCRRNNLQYKLSALILTALPGLMISLKPVVRFMFWRKKADNKRNNKDLLTMIKFCLFLFFQNDDIIQWKLSSDAI